MADEPPPQAKRQKTRRYSCQPDLEVVVESEVFHVYAADLMRASDVFKTMLESDMREAQEGRIILEGKSKDEFRTLLGHISVLSGGAPPKIDQASVELLLKWADEYQIIGLTSRCDVFLSRHVDCDCAPDSMIDTVNLANKYVLANTQRSVARTIAKNLSLYRHSLSHVVEMPWVMQEVLPALYSALNLESSLEKPADDGPPKLKDLMPLVIRALDYSKSPCVSLWLEAIHCLHGSCGLYDDGGGKRPTLDDLKRDHAKHLGTRLVERVVEHMRSRGIVWTDSTDRKGDHLCTDFWDDLFFKFPDDSGASLFTGGPIG